MNLEQKIEAILFFKAEPVKINKLAQITGASDEEVLSALEKLKESNQNRGVIIILNTDEAEMATSSEASEIIEELSKEELSKDLGRAGLETLSIVLYQGPIAKAEIDHIRGVNSGFILRNLQIRGLVARDTNPKDSRSYIYKPTLELLAHLGITNVGELPELEKTREEISKIMTHQEEENNDPSQA